jgi:hypothetical protein
VPAALIDTSEVVSLTRSRMYRSPCPPPGVVRSVALLSNVTLVPSALRTRLLDSPLPASVPAALTDTSSVTPVVRSRT